MENGILCLNRGYDRYGCTSDLKTESSHRSIELTELRLKLVNKRYRIIPKNYLVRYLCNHRDTITKYHRKITKL